MEMVAAVSRTCEICLCDETRVIPLDEAFTRVTGLTMAAEANVNMTRHAGAELISLHAEIKECRVMSMQDIAAANFMESAGSCSICPLAGPHTFLGHISKTMCKYLLGGNSLADVQCGSIRKKKLESPSWERC